MAEGQFVLVHADESCLGNQNAGPSRGGAGALIEVRTGGAIIRKDLYLSSADTSNNKMALTGASRTLQALAGKGNSLDVVYVSDSRYLVQGIMEWLPGWKARGWTRKAGPIENLEMWRELDNWNRQHRVRWKWVRGHSGHPKNEYADHLAVTAAENQRDYEGLVESRFEEWLHSERARNKYLDYDPDADFGNHERSR